LTAGFFVHRIRTLKKVCLFWAMIHGAAQEALPAQGRRKAALAQAASGLWPGAALTSGQGQDVLAREYSS
jgi:hypothetical protein